MFQCPKIYSNSKFLFSNNIINLKNDRYMKGTIVIKEMLDKMIDF